MKIIILAGGSGTRLWPLSRDRFPKQFLKIMNDKLSLFQHTFLRSLMLVEVDEVVIVTNEIHKFLVMGQLEELGYNFNENNLIIETEAKNTLPAIYAGVNQVVKERHDTIVVFPSDHIIMDNEIFVQIIKNSVDLSKEYIVTFGIKPDRPDTGFGYVSLGEGLGAGFLVKEFKEKPNHEAALDYMKEGYLWNSGIFMFHSRVFLEETETYAPEIHKAFRSSSDLSDVYENIGVGISIDYGILEKSNKVAVVPSHIQWSDLGSFDSFYDIFEKNEDNNITDEKNILINSTNNIIHSEKDKLVAVVGVEDLIIINDSDALLICKKNQSQMIKDVVNVLKERKDPRTEYHVQDYRTWGHYRKLDEEMNSFRINKLTINKGKKLRCQVHHHRSEHWIVVKGLAKVTINDQTSYVRTGESIFISAKQKHRIENAGETPLEIIEVQLGHFLSEDDTIIID